MVSFIYRQSWDYGDANDWLILSTKFKGVPKSLVTELKLFQYLKKKSCKKPHGKQNT